MAKVDAIHARLSSRIAQDTGQLSSTFRISRGEA